MPDFLFVNKMEILDKITPKMEQAGYDDMDIMAIRAIAIYEGVNTNGALFHRDDLEKAERSFSGKPLFILFENNNPTGHGFDRKTKTFDKRRKAIGVIQWAYGQENEETKRYEIIVEIAVWQKYYPEIASRLRQLHAQGELKFSIEADRDFEETSEGFRRCFNILFRGLCVVQNPAFEDAKSLILAELFKDEGGYSKMDEKQLQQLMETIKSTLGTELAEQITTLTEGMKTELAQLKTANEGLVAELASAKEAKLTVDGELASVKTERDTYKGKVETAEKEALGVSRLEKLSKYGEVKETAQELAELSQEAWLGKLEETVSNFKPTPEQAENFGKDNIHGVAFEKGKKRSDRKTQLLGFVKGLNK